MLSIAGLPRRPELRILCLGAHCDDIEIGCGGSLLRLISEWAAVHVSWVVFTGTAERERETRRAAACLLDGTVSSSVEVHDFRDGFLPSSGPGVKETFEGLKHRLSPDLVFTHYRDDAHQDHRLVSDLTWNTFRDHTILEYEIPKYDGDLGRPNLYVHLAQADCDRKLDVLMTSFRSQVGRRWFDDETFRSLLRLRGVECNAPERYAEAFYARKLVF